MNANVYENQLFISSEKPKRSGLSNAARHLGRKGGKSKSEAKKAASRRNGKKGGRPPKKLLEVKSDQCKS